MTMHTGKIGLYSAGLRAYWAQFPGLRDRMEYYNRFVAQKLSQFGTVCNFGILDNADCAERRRTISAGKM